MFVHKVHRSETHVLLAVCDKELLGRTLRGKMTDAKQTGVQRMPVPSVNRFDFEINEKFYGSEECSTEGVLELAKSATMINAVGNKIVDLLVEKGFADKDGIIVIDKVKHCQVYVI